MSVDVEFLIIGGGLAGRIFQLEVAANGHSSLLFDEPEKNRSSVVAAGIVNPITGKYFSLSWRASEFFPKLSAYYTGLEDKLDQHFFHPMPIQRLLPSVGDENTWLSKAGQDKYRGFFSMQEEQSSVFESELQSLMIQYGGYLDIPAFLQACDQMPSRNEKFSMHHLDIEKSIYKDITYKYLVFCEGYYAVQNPLFSYLPFTPNKGELLEIYAEALPQDRIVVGSVFMLPTGDNKFKIGATYDHHDLSEGTTENKREELLTRFSKMVNCDFEVLNHWYGIRPAVRDRRPLLGQHPDFENIYIFNGLGSKAASMAPVLASELYTHIVQENPLHSEADISRFTRE